MSYDEQLTAFGLIKSMEVVFWDLRAGMPIAVVLDGVCTLSSFIIIPLHAGDLIGPDGSKMKGPSTQHRQPRRECSRSILSTDYSYVRIDLSISLATAISHLVFFNSQI